MVISSLVVDTQCDGEEEEPWFKEKKEIGHTEIRTNHPWSLLDDNHLAMVMFCLCCYR